jgi:hypothetical protein
MGSRAAHRRMVVARELGLEGAGRGIRSVGNPCASARRLPAARAEHPDLCPHLAHGTPPTTHSRLTTPTHIVVPTGAPRNARVPVRAIRTASKPKLRTCAQRRGALTPARRPSFQRRGALLKAQRLSG